MSGQAGGQAEQTERSEQEGGTNGADKGIGGNQTKLTDGETKQTGRMGGRMGGRSGRKGKQSGRTAETPHRHSEDSQNAGLNHAAGEENDNPAPERPDGSESDGSGDRERKPGADRPGADRTGANRTEVEAGSGSDRSRSDGSRSDGSGSDGSGSAQKTIRNQRTIISVCPSALTLCDARQ